MSWSSTTAPLVVPETWMPADLVSSFSGIRPAEMMRLSQAMSNSVPGTGRRFSSTWATVTAWTLPLPLIWMTVLL